MLPSVRQYMAIIDIRKIGAHVTEESIKPYFSWLTRWPQALDLKWLPAWRLALVLLYSTNKRYWLCFLLPVVISSEKIFFKILISTISLSSSKTVLEQFQTLPSRVSCIWLLPPTRCRASFGLCLRTGVTQGVFLEKMTARWLKSQACMLEVERSWVWVYPGKICLAWLLPLARLGLSSLPSDLTPLSMNRGKKKPKQLIVSQVGPHLCLQSFVSVTALLPSPQTQQC